MKTLILCAVFLLISSVPALSKVYVVKRGDTLIKIAKKFHTTVYRIKRANRLKGSRIRVGQRLYIPPRFHSVSWYRRFKPKRSLETIEFIEKKSEIVRESIVQEEIYPITDVVYREAEALSEVLTTPLNFKYDNWGLSILNDPQYRGTFLKVLAEIFKDLRNTPYVFGGSSPRVGLDCSSFTMYVYRKLGVKLPRTARAQFNVGMPVDVKHLKVGDLVFFRTYASYPSHVGIYIGNGKFIHFSSMYHGLAISSLNDRYFKYRFLGAKRVLSEKRVKRIVDSFYAKR